MYCGLDFGTSNSTLGVTIDNNITMVPLDGEYLSIPSAIFLSDLDKRIFFGRSAIQEYLHMEDGRLLRSIKSVLGSSLMDDKTRVFNEMRPFSDVLGFFISHIKSRAELFADTPLDSVVIGRPVRFHDTDDEKDRLAEETLRSIAVAAGFRHIAFLPEPVAAARTYSYTHPHHDGGCAVIIDIGGGTSDFTALLVGDHASGTDHDILSTAGIHIGGTDIDKLLSLTQVMPLFGYGSRMRSSSGAIIDVPITPYIDLSTWHRIPSLYSRKSLHGLRHAMATAIDKVKISRLFSAIEHKHGHHILGECEAGKIRLSDTAETQISLDFVEAALSVPISRDDLSSIIAPSIDQIMGTLTGLLGDASLLPEDVNIAFFTGGTSRLGYLQSRVMDLLKNATPITGDSFTSVGFGLALDARTRFQ